MERASRILGSTRLGRKVCSQEQLAHAVWRAAVGKRLAAHAHPSWLAGKRLTVEVADEMWVAQLEPLLPQILRKMATVAGYAMVEEVRLAIAPRRRSMAVERSAAGGRQGRLPLEDAREFVEDPVLARIYESARRRAMATEEPARPKVMAARAG
ncbi:MAG: DUF721 domain-containing protein [Bryobacterales bacterium]|nr:DUF721 domain-containing protein [Bryobacterales bacterium]